MENFYLHELINAARGEFLLGDPHSLVRTLSIDSRTIRKGDYFIAISGNNFDGHAFLKTVIEKGAAGIIVSKQDLDLGNPFPVFPAVVRVADTTRALGDIAGAYRRKWRTPLAAVTGSNGKTTTKEMLASILGLKGKTLHTAGNFNNQIGLPLTLVGLASEHEYAVVEMGSSYPGEIARLAEIAAPDIGVITNIGLSHLERLKNREGVLAEKRALLDGLHEGGCGIVNIDDPMLKDIRLAEGRELVTYGTAPDAMVRATNVRFWPEKPSFDLTIDGRSVGIKLAIFGGFNISNALAAAAAAWKAGAGLETIKAGLERFSPVGMRMETRELASGVTLINDAYNANPSSMRASVRGVVESFPDRVKVAVLGDMLELGEGADTEHRSLGEFLDSQPFSKIFLYGPRMEKAAAAMKGHGRHYPDKESLEIDLKRSLAPGSVVLVKGSRGMRLEEIVEHLLLHEEI